MLNFERFSFNVTKSLQGKSSRKQHRIQNKIETVQCSKFSIKFKIWILELIGNISSRSVNLSHVFDDIK